jgi:crotonobetainyl-CoA:carnitine CoA-transferase CaiB-like acyl-CoA transferase
MEKLLDGVRVLELGNDISVRYAGKMLADIGSIPFG